MKASFTRDDFTDAIKWTTDVIDSKDDLATVRLVVNDDGTAVFSSVSSNGERTITVPVTVEDPVDSPFELVSGALKKVPAQITSDTIVLSYTDKDKTQVSANVGIKLKIPLMSSQNRPIHGSKGMSHIGTLAPADLFYVINKMAGVSDTTVTDSRFYCMYFETQDDDHVKAVATEGFVLTTRLLSYNKGDEGDYSFLLPSSDIKAMSDAVHSTAVDLYSNDDAILFSFDDGRTARVSKIDQEYVNYHALVFGDRHDEKYFDVAFEDLRAAVTKLGAWSTSDEDNNVYLDVIAASNEVKIHNSSNTWGTTIQFVGDLDEDYHAVYKYSTIIRTLNTADAETIRWKFIAEPANDTFDYGVIWTQIKNDGSVDEDTYLFSMPITPNHL